LNRLAFAGDREGIQVVGEIGHFQHPALRTLAAARQHFQAGRQLLQGEGLGHVVVGAGLEAGELLLQGVAGGEHQHRRLLVGFVAQFAGHVQAVHARQGQVQHDHVEFVDHGQVQARDAISGEIHHMAAIFQIVANIRRDIAVVFNHQNAHASLPLRSRHTGRRRHKLNECARQMLSALLNGRWRVMRPKEKARMLRR
jgi:hypothetical protein